ncbi:MAG: hypothetical protein NTX32_04840 [Candidatus Firestonebacteria bacterium]|nr:hypothetical protein [Candidatus Firestonebacteria bacterium]
MNIKNYKTLTILLAVGFFFGCAAVEKERKTEPSPVRKELSEKQKAYNNLLAFHKDRRNRLLSENMLVLSWLPKGENELHLLCLLDYSGSVTIYKNLTSINSTFKERYIMEAAAFSGLKQALDQIPPPEAAELKPKVSSYILSYNDRALWRTYEYTQRNMPAAVKNILTLLKIEKIKKK